jgi:hypothetical protein
MFEKQSNNLNKQCDVREEDGYKKGDELLNSAIRNAELWLMKATATARMLSNIHLSSSFTPQFYCTSAYWLTRTIEKSTTRNGRFSEAEEESSIPAEDD